jgi:hypothetical protein
VPPDYPATIRTRVLTCGAILGRAGRRLVVHSSQSWGGLNTRIPLLDSILNWQLPTAPNLDRAFVTWVRPQARTPSKPVRKEIESAFNFGIQA